MLLGAAATLAAQPTQPVIRVTTRLVEVDVIARDKHGAVADLTKDDFTILDNTKPQKVASFDKRERGAGQGAPASMGNAVSAGDAGATAAPPGSTVVLLDLRNADAVSQYRAKDYVLRFLRRVGRGDRVAIFSLAGGVQMEQDFTQDPALLEAAVERGRWGAGYEWAKAKQEAEIAALRANAPVNAELAGLVRAVGATFVSNNPPGMDGPDRGLAQEVVGTCIPMIALAKYLGRAPGRKSVLWMTAAFPLAGLHVLFTDEVSQMNHAFTDANAAVYPIDVRGLMVMETEMFQAPLPSGPARANGGSRTPATGAGTGGSRRGVGGVPGGLETMNYVAHFTGGKAFYNRNDVAKAMSAAVEDGEVMYALGFYPDSADLDSRRHVLKVATDHKGVELRYRIGYTATPDEAAAKVPARDRIAEAIWSPLDTEGIGLAARAEPGDAPGLLRIVLSVPAKDIVLRHNSNGWGGGMVLLYTERAVDGRDLGAITEEVDLRYDDPHYRRFVQDGLTYPRLVRPAAGAAQIRVVAYDRGSGRLGSITLPLK